MIKKPKNNTFTIFKKQPLNLIAKKLKMTGLYKDAFIEGLVDGLSKSSIYKN